MPSNDQLVFPTPRDWQELQRMTCDLFREIWKDPFAAEFGTLGQRQHCVDVYGKRGESLEGVQCKLTDNLTEKEVNDEYKKSRSFQPKLKRFIIVTTAKPNTKPQQAAISLSTEECRCDLMFWDNFCARMGQYPELIRKHYSQFVVVEMLGDAASKLVRFGADTDHFEMMLTAIPKKTDHYGGTILVSDLLTRCCTTYRFGDHYSRLEETVGNRWRAFVVSTWLNRFKNVEDLMRLGKEVFYFDLTKAEREEGRGEGLHL